MQLLSFLAGFLSAIFAEPIRQWLFRPKIELRFGSGMDFKTPTPATSGNLILQWYVVRVKVKTKTRRLAKSCRAFLMNIEKMNSQGEFERTIYSDSLQLHWSVREPDDYTSLDLPYQVSQYVDVFFTQQNSRSFLPCFRFFPLRYQGLFEEQGTFRFTVQVAGDGIRPDSIRLVLEWKGKWDDFNVYRDK